MIILGLSQTLEKVSLNSSYNIILLIVSQRNKRTNQQTKEQTLTEEQSSHKVFKKVRLVGTAPVIVYLSLKYPET